MLGQIGIIPHTDALSSTRGMPMTGGFISIVVVASNQIGILVVLGNLVS
jgi:hypothetical protein